MTVVSSLDLIPDSMFNLTRDGIPGRGVPLGARKTWYLPRLRVTAGQYTHIAIREVNGQYKWMFCDERMLQDFAEAEETRLARVENWERFTGANEALVKIVKAPFTLTFTDAWKVHTPVSTFRVAERGPGCFHVYGHEIDDWVRQAIPGAEAPRWIETAPDMLDGFRKFRSAIQDVVGVTPEPHRHDWEPSESGDEREVHLEMTFRILKGGL